jgi:hypothetical protein
MQEKGGVDVRQVKYGHCAVANPITVGIISTAEIYSYFGAANPACFRKFQVWPKDMPAASAQTGGARGRGLGSHLPGVAP